MPNSREMAHKFCRCIRPRLVGSLTLSAAIPQSRRSWLRRRSRVWVDWPKVRDLGDPDASAWSYRVAVNHAYSRWRRRAVERRVPARLGIANEQVDPAPDDALELRCAVASLPRRQRTNLVLRYYADLPVAHVVDLMGCAPGP